MAADVIYFYTSTSSIAVALTLLKSALHSSKHSLGGNQYLRPTTHCSCLMSAGDRGFDRRVMFLTAMALFSHQSVIAHVGHLVRPNVFVHKAIITYLNLHCHL